MKIPRRWQADIVGGSGVADDFLKLVESRGEADAAIVTGRDAQDSCKAGKVFKEMWIVKNSVRAGAINRREGNKSSVAS